MSLMDTYRQLADLDREDAVVAEGEQEKEAAAGEADASTVKLAQDYDEVGRRLARVMYGNWKQAAAESETEEKEEREGLENHPSGRAPSEKEDEEKDKAKKRKKEGDGEEQMAEKKASILAQLREDPEFRARALEWLASSQS